MPLVRISLIEGKTSDYIRAVGDIVHNSMVETINCPPLDRFQIISEHNKTELIYDPNYLGINRTDNIIIIQITLNEGRTTDLKKALYARIAQMLEEKLGIRPEDVLISLIEVRKENWSFGRGVASYA
jgi:phenylpyruvate tautomerase PptA (4-oxalocrotonate tautomerase family)